MKHIALIAILLSTPAIANYATWYGNHFHGRLTASELDAIAEEIKQW